MSIPIKKPQWATPSGGLVNYKDLVSKSKPLMNDEEFMKTARELARKDYAKGIRAEEGFVKLL